MGKISNIWTSDPPVLLGQFQNCNVDTLKDDSVQNLTNCEIDRPSHIDMPLVDLTVNAMNFFHLPGGFKHLSLSLFDFGQLLNYFMALYCARSGLHLKI